MAKKDKRLDKARANPQNITYDELDAILTGFGFVNVRAKGSHNQYRHPKSAARLSIPKHGSKVKQVYVEEALAAIDSLPEDWDD